MPSVLLTTLKHSPNVFRSFKKCVSFNGMNTNLYKRIKDIMSKAEEATIGVRVGVKSGGCAGMSYIMEYAKDIKPNEEV